MYAAILRSCPAEVQAHAIKLLGTAFGVKDGTAQSVIASVPIILVDDLEPAEAAFLQMALHQLSLWGADLQFDENPEPELPKIDWPTKPKIFKRSLPDNVAACGITVPVDGGEAVLIDLLLARLTGQSAAVATASPAPAPAPVAAPAVAAPAPAPMPAQAPEREQFTGSDLGEITPFSSPALPAVDPSPPQAAGPGEAISAGDVGSRMDELFGMEEANLVPNAAEVGNIIDSMMPADEAGIGTPANGVAAQGGGFSVFLAKIADPSRREKATPLLAELAGISEDEAATLAKKVIIPVLRGVSKDEADAAKHRFAEIGVLARIKKG